MEIDFTPGFIDNKKEHNANLLTRYFLWEKEGGFMKKLRIQMMSLLLATLLLLGALPMGALAWEDAEALPVEIEVQRTADGEGGYDAVLENRETLGGGDPLLSRAETFGAPAASYNGGDMYGQLTERQKACYDALEAVTIDRLLSSAQVQHNKLTYHRVLVQVPKLTGISIAGTFSGGKFIPSKSAASIESGIYTDLCAAIVALRYDRPDALWLSHLQYGYKVVQSGSAVKVTDVIFDFYLEYGGLERDMHKDMMKRAEEIAAEAGRAPDTYSKVKAVHDLLAQVNTYGDPDENLAHTAYSALIQNDASEPVCDGYAKAFKIVCGLLDIPCVLASSATHMWNNVKMDDGEWYNLDLTWDDSANDAIGYDYFLIGSQTQVGGEVFSKEKDHLEENPYNVYLKGDKDNLLKPVTLSFPGKNKQAYVYQGGDYPPLTFPDVRRSACYYEPVEKAYELGLFQGNTDGLFQPSKNITRAEFALVTANALGVDLSEYGGSAFTDVPEGKWFSPAVAWAKEAGIMRGDGNGTFRPNAPITRQEMCVVISQALASHEETGSFTFPDDASIARWAKSAVYECYALGLVRGNEKGLFSPGGNTLRSEAATVFTKFVELGEPYLPRQ